MNYQDFTLVELRQLAKEKGTKNVSKLKKDELIDLLQNMEATEGEKLTEGVKSEEEFVKAEPIYKTEVGRGQVMPNEKSDTINYYSSSNTNYKVTNEDDNIVEGILEVLPDGYGFLRGKNYLSSPKDVYISPVQIKRFKLDKGDKIKGIARTPKEGEKFPALIYVGEVNGEAPEKAYKAGMHLRFPPER